MRNLFYLPALFLLLVSCATPKKETGVIADKCGMPSAITVKDLEAFGFTVPKNKIAVLRIFATWCPYCKEDFGELGGHYRNKNISPETVQVLLMSYKNRRESKATYDAFLRDTFPKFGIPSEAAQIVYVDKDFNELSRSKSAGGQAMFTGWQGVPFTLIFGKDGRLAYRGHFTNSPQLQDVHYDFIRKLSKEDCVSPAK